MERSVRSERRKMNVCQHFVIQCELCIGIRYHQVGGGTSGNDTRSETGCKSKTKKGRDEVLTFSACHQERSSR
jgi:hypothetical protein